MKSYRVLIRYNSPDGVIEQTHTVELEDDMIPSIGNCVEVILGRTVCDLKAKEGLEYTMMDAIAVHREVADIVDHVTKFEIEEEQ